jgi:glycosyltransferase involved in cell wall biosynthesis
MSLDHPAPKVNEPLFSVVIPTHNRPAMLAEAIASVVRQTLGDWELIVVDDASDDPAVVPDDPRIRLLRLAAPVAIAVARNSGVEASRGRFLAFLDDDDLYTEDRLAMVLEGLDRAPIVTCWTRFLDRPAASNVTLEGDVSDSILDRLTPCVGATSLRREVFIPFDARWRGVEDIEWWLRIAARSPVATVEKVGYLFRLWRDVSQEERRLEIQRRVDSNLELLAEYAEYFRGHRRASAFRLKRVGLMRLALGDRRGARSALLRSLARHPAASTAWHAARSLVPHTMTR